MTEPPRRFPTPWHADPMPGGYVVRDANGQALAYLYCRDKDAEARQAKVLTKDEARRIAVNVAMPESGESLRAPQRSVGLRPVGPNAPCLHSGPSKNGEILWRVGR
jgi:hypothetical protein